MQLKYKLLVVALVCVINFGVNNQYLSPDIMEARNLITAREMAATDNWLNPTMNGYPRLAKPPLPTWVNAAIAKFFPVDNLAVHRIPAAIMGFLMVLAIFFITKSISGDENVGYYSSLAAASSYYLILMSRQATWDIYCHSLMAVAIAFLIGEWRSNKDSLWSYLMAGTFMGLSFMSKGPVSFYVILLPFLVSWFLFIEKKSPKAQWRGILIMTVVFLVVGFSWPCYQLITNKDLLLKIVDAESTAWTERHVKPFYQYWGFWSHVGIWSLFALVSLVYPLMKSRIPLKEYKFLLWWLVIMVVLLSIPGEKKERYLLPVIIPLSCLIGYFINYLLQSQLNNNLSVSDKRLIRVNILLLLIISLLFPFTDYFTTSQPHVSIITFIIFWSTAVGLFFAFKSLKITHMMVWTIVLMSAVTIFGLKKLEPVTNQHYDNLAIVREKPFYTKDFYAANLNPKEIFAIGKTVDTLKIEKGAILNPRNKEFVIASYYHMDENEITTKVSTFQLMDSIAFDKKNDKNLLYFYLVKVEIPHLQYHK
jgi:4-amino-4-deoxy-L-arabinose transferase-like glycosyltransferase